MTYFYGSGIVQTSGSQSGLYGPLGAVGLRRWALRGKGVVGWHWRWALRSALLGSLRLK
jgi:hypothetical protein